MVEDNSPIDHEDWLRTPKLSLTIFNETPTDGIAWYGGYSDPYLVINLEARLQSFEVASDGGSGYKGIVVPGDFSFVPPGAPLGGNYLGTRMRYASVTFPQQRLNPLFTDSAPIVMGHDPIARTFIGALLSRRDYSSPSEILYLESITEALVQHLQLVHLESPYTLQSQRYSLDKLTSYVRANLAQKITVAELASVVGISSQSLQHMVKQQFDQSVYEWVITLRLEKSLELLRTTKLDLASIAIATGFNNQSHWTRLFKRKFSTTPGKIPRP